MVPVSSFEDALLRLESISLLKRLKKYYKYRDLEKYFSLDVPLLNKYVRGKLLPGKRRANKIIEKILEMIDLKNEIKNSISHGIYDYPELANLSASSPDLLFYIAVQAYQLYKKADITKVLSVEGGGLIIASLISTFLCKGLVYALRDHYARDAIVEPYSASLDIAHVKYTKFIALPRKSLNSKDKVLIVDDIIWSGALMRALLNIVKKLGSKIVGVFCIGVSSEEIAKSLEEDYKVKIDYLVEINSNY